MTDNTFRVAVQAGAKAQASAIQAATDAAAYYAARKAAGPGFDPEVWTTVKKAARGATAAGLMTAVSNLDPDLAGFIPQGKGNWQGVTLTVVKAVDPETVGADFWDPATPKGTKGRVPSTLLAAYHVAHGVNGAKGVGAKAMAKLVREAGPDAKSIRKALMDERERIIKAEKPEGKAADGGDTPAKVAAALAQLAGRVEKHAPAMSPEEKAQAQAALAAMTKALA